LNQSEPEDHKNPDIAVGSGPAEATFTPGGKSALVANALNGTVSTIDVKTRTTHPTDIPVGTNPGGVTVTPSRG
jgi:YVTN family beta-propeller protein